MEHLLREVKQLADDGVKEIILVSAGDDALWEGSLWREKTSGAFAPASAKSAGVRPWIRRLYCCPEEITEELIQTIKEEPKLLSLPGSSDSTRQRRRPEKDGAPYVRRRSLFVSFPGSGKKSRTWHASHNADHRIAGVERSSMKKLMDFVDEMAFGRLRVFTYSAEGRHPRRHRCRIR